MWEPERCGVCFASLERIAGYGPEFGSWGVDLKIERHRGGEGRLCETCLRKRNNGQIPPVVPAITAKQPLEGGQLRRQATPDRCKSQKIGARRALVCRILPK